MHTLFLLQKKQPNIKIQLTDSNCQKSFQLLDSYSKESVQVAWNIIKTIDKKRITNEQLKESIITKIYEHPKQVGELLQSIVKQNMPLIDNEILRELISFLNDTQNIYLNFLYLTIILEVIQNTLMPLSGSFFIKLIEIIKEKLNLEDENCISQCIRIYLFLTCQNHEMIDLYSLIDPISIQAIAMSQNTENSQLAEQLLRMIQ